MNDTDRFSDALSQTSEIVGVNEDVEIAPRARYVYPGKQWIKLVAVEEIKQGASRFKYAEKACFVVRDDETFQVFDSICPHKAVNIPSDAIEDMTLVCPMHYWRFNLENGECLEKGNYTPLTKITHNVEDGILYLFV